MLHDLRYAFRSLRQNPGFALVAIVSIALGIGANAAMYSFADALLLRPMPVPDPSGIMTVQAKMLGEALTRFDTLLPMSYPNYVDLRDRNRSFSGLTAARFASFGFATEKEVLPQMRFGELVSGNFFSVLRVDPVLGRTFRPDEDQVRGRDAVVVLGYDVWKNDLAGNRDVIGRAIFLNGLPFTVIGVAPERFPGSNGLVRTALFVPLMMEPRLGSTLGGSMLDQRDAPQLTVHGRLRPGVSIAQAEAEVQVIGEQLAQAYPASNRTTSFLAAPDQRARIERDPFDALLVYFLMALAVVVLIIACANVMNLMLSRAGARSREIAVRLAIGAGRIRLIRQLLTESLLIALLGGAAGLLVAEAGVDVFSQIRIPSAFPVSIDTRLDPRALSFALMLSVASALVFGLAPAIQTSHPELTSALKSSKAEGGRRRRLLGRNGLVVAQVAGSLVLIVFATQAYRGAAITLSASPGFRTDHLLIASFDPALARYTPAASQEFYRRLLERVRALNGVKSAALAQDVPMGVNGGGSRVVPEGVQLAAGAEAVLVQSNRVSDGYFDTMDIPIVEGRGFRDTDRPGSPLVVIVNELFARKYYPTQSPIGKRMRITGQDGGMAEIVGVAKQSKYSFIVEPPLQYVYLPAAQFPQTGMTVLVQTAGPPGDLAKPLREVVWSLDPSQPMFGVSTLGEFFEQRARKLLSVLTQVIAGLAGLGLVIALVGLYGLMTYSVGLRQREIGIRIAIGAEPVGVLKMVLKRGLVLALTGVGIGLVLTALASRGLTLGIGIASFNVPLVAGASGALLAAAAFGAFLPARRASLLDPNAVLRQE